MDYENEVDCLIIGAGPAGLTAALYLRRFHRTVVLADSGQSRARYIERAYNYPGFPDGVGGEELLTRLRQQLAHVQGNVTPSTVSGLAAAAPRSGFQARVGNTALHARTVLIATGVVDEVPEVPGTQQVRNSGLLRQCPVCDGYEHSGRRIAVIGDGPHAQREAHFIAHYSPHVALAGLTAPHRAAPGTVACLPATVRSMGTHADGGVELTLSNGSHHVFDILYAAMGVQPRCGVAHDLGVQLSESGHLLVDAHGRTNVPQVYAAGDVVEGLAQLSVAAAQGATAATAMHQFLLRFAFCDTASPA